jgi:uncharacterized membrane protein YeaQ/YmgE (transglycosylase-associated protein family)
MGVGELIALIAVGLVVGALGRLLSPGRDPMGLVMTVLIGVASLLVAGFVFGGILQWVVGIAVAVVLVWLYAYLAGADRTSTPAART